MMQRRVTNRLDERDSSRLGSKPGGGSVDEGRAAEFVVKDKQPALMLTQHGDGPKFVIKEDEYS